MLGWTKLLPKKRGYYWAKMDALNELAVMVYVQELNNCEFCIDLGFDCELKHHERNAFGVYPVRTFAWWYGPLAAPRPRDLRRRKKKPIVIENSFGRMVK